MVKPALLLAGAAMLRLAVAAAVPLFPDETYYWEWSRRLAPGYFDHPPMIAALIRGGTWLLGPTPLGVRLGAVLCGTAAAVVAWLAALTLAGRAAADRAAIAATVLPILAGSFLLATPEAPLLMAVALLCLALVQALSAASARGATGWWLLAGLAGALGLGAKLTMAPVLAGIAVALLLRRELRPQLTRAGPWLGLAVGLLLVLPLVGWQAQHGWPTIAFQLGHGLGTGRGGSMLGREAGLLAGQLLVATPLLLPLAVVAAWRGWRNGGAGAALAGAMLGVAAVFGLSAALAPVEANWPAPAYIPAAVLLGAAPFGRRLAAWRRGGFWVAAAASLVLLVQPVVPVLPLPARRDPTAGAHGWGALAKAVAAELSAGEGSGREWVAADRYQDASELAFLLPGRPRVFSLNLGGRTNQYRYWPGFAELASPGDDLLLLLPRPASGERHAVAERLAPCFGRATPRRPVERRRGDAVLDRRVVWRMENWRGTWPTDEARPCRAAP